MVTRQGGAVQFVDVMLREGRAHFHGNVRCASWSACPVCSWQIRGERAAEVTAAVQWWRAQGGQVELLTLTLAHGMGDDLRSLRFGLQACWRKLWAGEPGKRLRAALGMVHYIRGTDDTYGGNGWHPHLHVIVLSQSVRDRSHAVSQLKARWHACVLSVLGRHHVPSWTRGADVRVCNRDEYIAKLGLELSSSTKEARRGGRTPWDIARDAANDDEGAAVELWQTYTRATKGVRQLVWSRGLRKAAQLGAEQTDQEIVDAEGKDAEETRAASVPARLWDEVARMPGALADILRGAELDGRMGVANAIALHAWGLAPPDPGEDPDQLTLDLFEEIAPREDSPMQAAA